MNLSCFETERMTRILFVAINARYVHTNLALLYLKKISGKGVETDIAEFNISQHAYDILAEICSHDPDVVAFSVYIWNVRLVKELVSDIKKVLPVAKVILGGPEVGYNAEQWLDNYGSLDYIITGEGEQSWLALLESDFSYPGKILSHKNKHLSEIPFPYASLDREMFKDRIIYYESSRGCPYRCSYCISSRQDVRLEFRKWETVQQELLFFIREQVPLVKFVDRTFNADPEFARDIWGFLKKESRQTRFHFEINPLLLSAEDIEILKDVPQELFQFEIGVQSTNRQTLQEIRRQGEWLTIKEKIAALLKNTSIPVHLDLIFGLPYEDYQSAQRSFNEVYNLKPHHFQPGMLKVLLGTVMKEKAADYGLKYQQEAPYKIIANKWLSFEELISLQNIEHLVNNLFNSHKYIRTLENLVELAETPFRLFSGLQQYWKARQINLWQKDWQKTALLLAEYVSENYPSGYKLILDCLRWDLCSVSGLQFYPEILLTSEIRELMNKWKKYLKSNIDQVCQQERTAKKNIQRSLLFRASSQEFREKYEQQEKDCFVFFDAGKKCKKQLKVNYLD